MMLPRVQLNRQQSIKTLCVYTKQHSHSPRLLLWPCKRSLHLLTMDYVCYCVCLAYEMAWVSVIWSPSQRIYVDRIDIIRNVHNEPHKKSVTTTTKKKTKTKTNPSESTLRSACLWYCTGVVWLLCIPLHELNSESSIHLPDSTVV